MAGRGRQGGRAAESSDADKHHTVCKTVIRHDGTVQMHMVCFPSVTRQAETNCNKKAMPRLGTGTV